MAVIEYDEYKQKLQALEPTLGELEKALGIPKDRQELKDLQAETEQDGFWNNIEHSQKVSQQIKRLEHRIKKYDRLVSEWEDTVTLCEMAQEEDDASLLPEVTAGYDNLEKEISERRLAALLSGEYDANNAILTFHAGAGGTEAQDWTDMLYRMYSRYVEKKGWKLKVLDVVPGEGIGLDRAVLQVEGKNAYGMLRSEHGVHRLVRISPTDIKGRRQTTFASVEVMPVMSDDIEVNLNPNDVRVDVYRSSGPGGQCVNTTDSAVRLTHIPTGIVVTCQNEKSQLMNKESAFKVLRGRLYELERQKRDAELDAIRGEKQENGFGSQIRNYVLYPYQLVKDLRSGVETSNVDAVLDGDIDEFVVGYHRWRVSQ